MDYINIFGKEGGFWAVIEYKESEGFEMNIIFKILFPLRNIIGLMSPDFSMEFRSRCLETIVSNLTRELDQNPIPLFNICPFFF